MIKFSSSIINRHDIDITRFGVAWKWKRQVARAGRRPLCCIVYGEYILPGTSIDHAVHALKMQRSGAAGFIRGQSMPAPDCADFLRKAITQRALGSISKQMPDE
jgi:hypothetical protein